MKIFLYVLIFCGAWNLINFIARIYYGEISNRYVYHIIIGIWAAMLLWW